MIALEAIVYVLACIDIYYYTVYLPRMYLVYLWDTVIRVETGDDEYSNQQSIRS